MGKRLSGKAIDEMLAMADAKGVKAAADHFGVSERTVVRRRAVTEEEHKTCKTAALKRHKNKLYATYDIVLERLAELMPGADMKQTLEAVKTVGELKLAHDALTGEVASEGPSNARKGQKAPEERPSLQGHEAGEDPPTTGQFYPH